MSQQSQVFELKRRDRQGQPLWAYRYRVAGRDSRRVQRGGFATEQDAEDALRARTRSRPARTADPRSLTLAELVETYLAQHDVQPVTIEKLRWLLSKANAAFGDRRIGELTSQEIAEWRMTLSPGYRFEATQALRQTLHRAVVWGMIDVNPAKVGVDNPTPRRKEQRPFESWAELETIAAALGRRYGPMIIFAAATGLRPAEWIALEKRDIDRKDACRLCPPLVHETRGQAPKDRGEPASRAAAGSSARRPRTTSRQRRLSTALPGRAGRLSRHAQLPLLTSGGPHNSPPASMPPRRVYDLRHTFATFALRAGISTFDLSRYMGASLTMIDRHYGHLARDGREHAIQAPRRAQRTRIRTVDTGGRCVDVEAASRRQNRQRKRRLSREENRSPLTDSNRRPPPYHPAVAESPL